MKSRIPQIDILRGFAILLIFPANIAIFSGYTTVSTFDHTLVWLFHLLFDATLYSLFTLLFGLGMAIQSSSEDFRKTWFKRMSSLGSIGIAHALLLSQADILLIYAILGCLLYFVRGWKTEHLLAAAFMLLAVPFLSNWFLWFKDVPMQPSLATYDQRFTEGLSGVFAGRYNQWIRYFLGQLLINFPNFFSMMLLGIVLARTPVGQWDTARFRRVGFYGIIPMVGYATIYTFLDGSIINWGNALITIGAPMLMFGYIGVLLWLAERYQSVQSLVYPGRLSLTLYIMQSLIGNIGFYGLRLYGQWSISQLIPLLICILIFQWGFSILYLQKFDMGLVEKFWRGQYLSTLDR